uniref:Uncharacterized protein n=1 Tax=Anguilla anguilla TaxID=7936 RepID=A0A0E9U8U5_ANGAN
MASPDACSGPALGS